MELIIDENTAFLSNWPWWIEWVDNLDSKEAGGGYHIWAKASTFSENHHCSPQHSMKSCLVLQLPTASP